jgi:hypothetical protein
MARRESTVGPGRTMRPVTRASWHWACTAEGCTVTRRTNDAATRHEDSTGHRMKPEDD